jgi:hypothetical protein
MRIVWLASMIAAAAVLAAAPASADRASKGDDPNEMVCERQEVIGSRLAKRKICMTRQEWTEQRRDDRNTVERHQLMSPVRPCAPPKPC